MLSCEEHKTAQKGQVSAGAKHDFRRVTLGVSPRGPAKSLIFLFLKEKSVLLRVFCRGVGKDRRHIHAVFPIWVYQDVPLGRPHGAERKVTFGTPVFCAVRSCAPSGRPSGAPLGTLLVPHGPYSLAPFPDRMVSTKSGQTQLHWGSGMWPSLFLYFGNFWPKAKSRLQSHVWHRPKVGDGPDAIEEGVIRCVSTWSCA